MKRCNTTRSNHPYSEAHACHVPSVQRGATCKGNEQWPGIAEQILLQLNAIFEKVRLLEKASCGPQEKARAIRLPEVLSIVGLRRSSWYERLNPRSSSYDERAPKPFRLGSKACAWWLHEVLAYVQQLSVTSRAH